jgi:hypothetical protein
MREGRLLGAPDPQGQSCLIDPSKKRFRPLRLKNFGSAKHGTELSLGEMSDIIITGGAYYELAAGNIAATYARVDLVSTPPPVKDQSQTSNRRS